MNELEYITIYELLLKNSSTCSLLVDLDGKIIRYNDAYTRLIGYTDDEIRKKDNTVYPSKAAYDREISFINQLLKGTQSDIKYRSCRLTKDGRTVQVEVTAILFRNQAGVPEFILKRIEDITDRVMNERLSQNQAFYLDTVLREIPISIYFKDKESRFITNSYHHIRSMGCESFNDVKGKTDADFFDNEHAREARADEILVMETGKPIIKEEHTTLKNGKIRWGQTVKGPLRDRNNEIIGTYGITKDITETKMAQEQVELMNARLKEKNQQLKETLEELSRTQNKLIFSEKMAALGNLIGGIAHEINTPLGAIKASSSNIDGVVEKINVDLPWIINNASPEEINWLFRLINESDARDLSVFTREERQMKRELVELFEEKGIENAPVIADTIVSLGLNKPIGDYLEFLSLPRAQSLLQMLKVMFSLKRNASNIAVSVDRASKVVRALKSYIHKTSGGAVEATNLNETVETVLILTANMLKHEKIEISNRMGDIPLVFCRQDELCQVWTNIITNAVQAMHGGGILEIGSTRKDDETIQIWFKDSGTGIPASLRDRIFEPYFTTKEKGVGTGMGLDISRQIIENHHGRIYFETEEGKGTTFFVEIPLNQDQPSN